MKKYYHKNHELNGHEISVGGTVYKRDSSGALHVLTGAEAKKQRDLLADHLKRSRTR